MNRWNRDVMFYEVARWVGLVGVLHETIIAQGQRPLLLGLFGSMMGVRKVLYQEPIITLEIEKKTILPPTDIEA